MASYTPPSLTTNVVIFDGGQNGYTKPAIEADVVIYGISGDSVNFEYEYYAADYTRLDPQKLNFPYAFRYDPGQSYDPVVLTDCVAPELPPDPASTTVVCEENPENYDIVIVTGYELPFSGPFNEILCTDVGPLPPVYISEVVAYSGEYSSCEFQLNHQFNPVFYTGSNCQVTFTISPTILLGTVTNYTGETGLVDVQNNVQFDLIGRAGEVGLSELDAKQWIELFPPVDLHSDILSYYDRMHGKVVTVGTTSQPGCLAGLDNYSTIQAAVNAVPTGSIIVVYPGTYNEQIDITNKKLVIVGAGTSPADVVLQDSNTGGYHGTIDLYTGANVFVENVTFNITGNVFYSGAIGLQHISCTAKFNKCRFIEPSGSSERHYVFTTDYLGSQTLTTPVSVTNCFISLYYSEHGSRNINHNSIGWYKCELSGISSLSWHNGDYSWVSSDWVTTPTVNYGINYGTRFAPVCGNKWYAGENALVDSLYVEQNFEFDFYDGQVQLSELDIHPSFSLFDVYLSDTAKEFVLEGGVVVTVGTNPGTYSQCIGELPNYSTIEEAINTVPSGSIIAIFPGNYEENIYVSNKSLVIVGLGNSPEDVIWYSTTAPYGSNYSIRAGSDVSLYCENLTLKNTSAWESTLRVDNPAFRGIFNKVYFWHGGSTHAIVARNSAVNVVFTYPTQFINCYITKGYDHFSQYHKSNIALYKTRFDSSINYHDCSGSTLANNDYVTTSTNGYGYWYGDLQVGLCKGVIETGENVFVDSLTIQQNFTLNFVTGEVSTLLAFETFPSALLDVTYRTGENVSCELSATKHLYPVAYAGERVVFDIDYIVNLGMPANGYTGQTLVFDSLSTTTTLAGVAYTGEYTTATLNPTYSLPNVIGYTGQVGYSELAINEPDRLAGVAYTGETLQTLQLSTQVLLRPNQFTTGEVHYVSLDTKPSFGFDTTRCYTGERPSLSIQTAISFGTTTARAGERLYVNTLTNEEHYKFYTGQTASISFFTDVAIPVITYTGERLYVSLETKPSGPIGTLRAYTDQAVYLSLEALKSAKLEVCFANNIGMTWHWDPRPVFDLTDDICCDQDLDLFPCNFDIELNQAPYYDTFYHGSHHLNIDVELSCAPRFYIDFYTGETFDLGKYEQFEEPVEFSLSFTTGESSYFVFNPWNKHRLCRGNFIPDGENIIVELNDVLPDDCYSDIMYTGQTLLTSVSTIQGIAPRAYCDERMEFQLTLNPPLTFRFYTGERFSMASEAILSPRAYTGQICRVAFEVIPYMAYTGQEIHLDISTDISIRFLENGCLPNEFQFLNNDGAKVKNDIKVAIELYPYKHDLIVTCK